MLRSMTGYGRGEASADGFSFVTEIRTVNHRYLEVVIRLPRAWSGVEDRVRQEITSRLNRGRVEVTITAQSAPESVAVRVNPQMVVAYQQAFAELRQLVGRGEAPEWTLFLNLPGVLETVDLSPDLEKVWPVLQASLSGALEELIRMRDLEGKRLADDLLHRLGTIEQLIKDIEARSPLVVEEYRQRLANRMKELLEGGNLDEGRLAMEVAFFAERSNITEELVRLASHIEQCRRVIQGTETAVGRRLDFLIQEMHREINTLGSKAADLMISQRVIDVKAELEKIREQVQNVE